MKPDLDALSAENSELCRIIAPDLGNRPLYILAQSRLPVEFGRGDATVGYTAPALDLYLRDTIGAAWRGRGPCMVINDLVLAEEYEPQDFEQFFRTTVLHELAHILDRPEAVAPARAAELADPERVLFESLAVAKAVAETPSPEASEMSFHAHGADFIRIALHLRHRAERLGAYVSPAHLCAGRRYRQSSPWWYVEALADEPEHLSGLPLREVARVPRLNRSPGCGRRTLPAMPPSGRTAFERTQKFITKRAARAVRRLERPAKGDRMGLSSLLERIVGRQKDRERARATDFRTLVRHIAGGETPDEGLLEAVLREADKTPEDLRAAVELVAQRRGWKDVVETAGKLEAERAEVVKQVAAAGQALEAAQAEHDRICGPLRSKLEQISEAQLAAESARRRLTETCDDPAVQAEMEEIARMRSAIAGKQSELSARLREHQNRLHNLGVELAGGGAWTDREGLSEQARHHRGQVKELERELAQITRQLTDLDRREEPVRQRMLAP